jgi:hypothetical protein
MDLGYDGLSCPVNDVQYHCYPRGKIQGYFLGVFRGRPCGRTVDKLSETDPIWACHASEPTACEERHAWAIVPSLTTNPYCS